MNTTGIEWTDLTWNPVTGCRHGCRYCYARGIARRFTNHFPKGFEPHYRDNRIDEPYGRVRPAKIFVCSMADLFGDWVPREWIESVLVTVRQCTQHTFQFLTKNPARLQEFEFPFNAWVGTTITNQADMDRAVLSMADVECCTKFISAEPLLGPIDLEGPWIPDWVIVGPMTGHRATPAPSGSIKALTEQCGYMRIPMFHKPSCGDVYRLREFPA